jgi:hypothetical protein
MERAIHTTAAQQTVVGRVDDGIHLQTGDVALYQLDHVVLSRGLSNS